MGLAERLEAALREGDLYFMGQSSRQRAASDLSARLNGLGIDFAIAGALALAAHGYERFTSDVDVLITREGLAKFKESHLGRGYVEIVPGGRGVRDTQNGVRIDFVVTGDFPGDGKPKPISFPHPAQASEEAAPFRVLKLETLIELKIASGMTAPHRLQDLADVIGLVRRRGLPRELAERLDAYVRPKFLELWEAAQQVDAEG